MTMASDASGRGGRGATDWSRRLGHVRRRRDLCAEQLAHSQQADAERAAALSTDRWVAIVGAVRAHVAAYNTGAGRVVLHVTEASGELEVTVAAGEGLPYVTATLEGPFVAVRARDALAVPYATEFRLCPERSDEATAAYLLRNWMERL
jgi:hypothetical protein